MPENSKSDAGLKKKTNQTKKENLKVGGIRLEAYFNNPNNPNDGDPDSTWDPYTGHKNQQSKSKPRRPPAAVAARLT